MRLIADVHAQKLAHVHVQSGMQKNTPLRLLRVSAGMASILTRECDVKASVGVGVVSQELQSGHVSAGCDGRRQDVAGEGAQDWRFSLTKKKKTKS